MGSFLDRIKNKHKCSITQEQKDLIRDYREAVAKMHQTRNAFENITEPELIESCVFEMNAAQCQCSYLLSKIKEEKLTSEMWT